MRVLLAVSAFALAACGGARRSEGAREPETRVEVDRLESSSAVGDSAEDDPAPVADLEVSVQPDVTRDDLLAEATRLRGEVEGCEGTAELDARIAELGAAPDERSLWHRYGLVVVVARRVRTACE